MNRHLLQQNPYHPYIDDLIDPLLKTSWFEHSISHNRLHYHPEPGTIIPFITLLGMHVVSLVLRQPYSYRQKLAELKKHICNLENLTITNYRVCNDYKISNLYKNQPLHLGTSILNTARQGLENGTAFANICKMLVKCEEKVGGPYNSWIVENFIESPYCHIDPAINGIIAHILKQNDIALPRLEVYFDSNPPPSAEIACNNLSLLLGFHPHSKSRFELCEELISKLNDDGNWGNIAETASAIIFLRNNRIPQHRIGRAYEFIRQSIDRMLLTDCPLLFDQRNSDQEWTISSNEFIRLLCASALITYDTIHEPHPTKSFHYLVRKFEDDTQAWDTSLRLHLRNKYLTYLDQPECRQAIEVPELIIETISPSMSIEYDDLAYANSLIWFSYRMLDDIIDERGRMELVPLASSALRLSFKNLISVPESTTSSLETILSRLDSAIHWEIMNAFAKKKGDSTFIISTLPNYGRLQQLAHKSYGAIVVPLLTLYRAGYKPHSKECIAFRNFFTSYLIARQLQDDAHDWIEDLKKGYINPVAVSVLEYYKKINNYNNQIEININNDLADLKDIYNNVVFPLIVKRIRFHIGKAKSYDIDSSPSTLLCKKLLEPLENGIQKARESKKNADSFIRTFLTP